MGSSRTSSPAENIDSVSRKPPPCVAVAVAAARSRATPLLPCLPPTSKHSHTTKRLTQRHPTGDYRRRRCQEPERKRRTYRATNIPRRRNVGLSPSQFAIIDSRVTFLFSSVFSPIGLHAAHRKSIQLSVNRARAAAVNPYERE